jgi:hypothetical protein
LGLEFAEAVGRLLGEELGALRTVDPDPQALGIGEFEEHAAGGRVVGNAEATEGDEAVVATRFLSDAGEPFREQALAFFIEEVLNEGEDHGGLRSTKYERRGTK